MIRRLLHWLGFAPLDHYAEAAVYIGADRPQYWQPSGDVEFSNAPGRIIRMNGALDPIDSAGYAIRLNKAGQ